MKLLVQSLALLSGLRIRHCRELRCRLGSGVAVDLVIRPLAWEPPYVTGVALKRKKKKKKTQKTKQNPFIYLLLLFRAAPVAYGCS